MGTDAPNPILLLLHDGELADVRTLAESAGAQVVECRPTQAPSDWDVLVATGRYAHGDHLRRGCDKAVRIAVLDRDTRSLRNLVRRSGFDLVVRRPVHPTALRLLLLHALYRGPERRSRRVAVGVPVRFRTGFLRKDGVLADLSLRGCQILSRHAPRIGQSIVVWVPDATPNAKPYSVRGQVVRLLTGSDAERGFGVDFGRVSKVVSAQVRTSMMLYLDGPAAIAGAALPDPGATQPLAVARSSAEIASEADPGETTEPGRRAPIAGRREVVRVRETFSTSPAPAESQADADERRRAARREYAGRRVVALGEEAARVLIGRDLSIGGMRVERAPNLAVGQSFRIALHVAAGQTPLVVNAEVLRDDGERGFAVRFLEVDEASARYLGKMVDSLPVLAGDEAVVVSEIVPTHTGS